MLANILKPYIFSIRKTDVIERFLIVWKLNATIKPCCSFCSFSEIEIRQKKGFISSNTLLLTVEDPQARVGSGGATLNALLVVAEHLSQQQGFTVGTV